MDLTTFKLDIDDLIDDFTRENFTTFTDMKKVWVAKKFSYIFEASPRSNSAFFMQSLFAHSIGHMGSSTSLSQRLGGLYCLYCLYETQPYKPRVKIYLCLGELKRFKLLVIEAKQNGILVVPALVKKMLAENMLLFGSSDSVLSTQRVEVAKKLEGKNLQIAYEKLVSNTEIEDYIHMNLGLELGLDSFKKMSQEYAKAKEEAIKEASNSVGMEDIKHIVESSSLPGDMVEKLVEEWDSQKESFYKQTGMNNCRHLVSVDDDEGFAEVERLLDE